MNDYYLPRQSYAPVTDMHNFYLYETPDRACFATTDDYGNMVPDNAGSRWYSLNT